MNKKKALETRLLSGFLEISAYKDAIEFLQPTETPDFTAMYQSKPISIELTALVNPIIRKKEQVQKRIVKSAEILFRENHQAELTVNVVFNNQPLLETSGSINTYGERIFKEIENEYLRHKGIDFHISIKKSANLTDFIDTIYINNKLSYGMWQKIGAYRVDWINKEYLSSVVAGKEHILDKYCTKYQQNWLILTSNHGTKSSAHRFDSIDFSDINSRFEKIFIYNSMENKIIELK